MPRAQALAQLQTGDLFDLLVIGGGATGCGIALDAATRGLKVALIDKNDFAEGTSSRSTKLLHGGVRYLEAAVKKLDLAQYNLVREGLRERALLLQNAPHLSRRILLVTPLYTWLDVPYVFTGLKFYDLLAGRKNIGHSSLLGKRKALQRFPMLKSEGLKAGVLYYDGQFLDARMALSIALTAQHHGAVIANHVEAASLLKQDGQVSGAQLVDTVSGQQWDLLAKGVINATGPFTDQIRQMDDPAAPALLKTSSGIHIVLNKSFAPPDTGLMIPETEDGRVLFVLPWEGHALVGTTDEPASLSEHPRPTEEEIAYLLRHVSRYFDLQVCREDIKATWSGLRPLVLDPDATDTATLARTHVLQQDRSGLLTIAGGKWTTYRQMAEDTVDMSISCFGLLAQSPCRTHTLKLHGGDDFTADTDLTLQRDFHLDPEITHHLTRAYGDRATQVCLLAKKEKLETRLHPAHPYIEAEIIYAVRHELAIHATDLLVRRLSLGLVDSQAAQAVLPRILTLMGRESNWDDARLTWEEQEAATRLEEAI